jgi:ergothioneine biosynthesis protein EgtB
VWEKILKSASIQFCREAIREALIICRRKTLELFTEIEQVQAESDIWRGTTLNSDIFCQQVHPDFSPIGWHLGHIAFTEAYWILERLANYQSFFPQDHRLFAADGLPKAQRQNLPNLAVIQDYLDNVRSKVLTYLETAPVEKQERLWRWLIQHESQHSETISFLWQLHRWQNKIISITTAIAGISLNTSTVDSPDMIKISSGEFLMGSDAIEAQDNERPAHKRYLDTYWLDRYPVTCRQYQEFMAAGGYQNRQYWSKEGWQWLQLNPVSQPLYWLDSRDWDNHPVCGVSYYEAEAYANFVGKRLPSEAEWEKAASWQETTGIKIETLPSQSRQCNHDNLIGHTTPVNAYPNCQSPYGCYDMLGNVWEWTTSWFAGYEGFTSYPYTGYSQAYFDNQHRVLKGGSWATRPWALRASFRNWYHPWVRQILVGFRCAGN